MRHRSAHRPMLHGHDRCVCGLWHAMERFVLTGLVPVCALPDALSDARVTLGLRFAL